MAVRSMPADCSFNPRAREGRDLFIKFSAPRPACFNPRAREGRDFVYARVIANGDFVSIHAPARGATPVLCTLIA